MTTEHTASPAPRRRRLFFALSGACLLFVFVCSCCWNVLDLGEHYPSDQELLDTFSAHRSTFFELQTMLTKDQGLCVNLRDGVCQSHWEFSSFNSERVAQYQSLFRTINVQSGESGPWHNGVWLFAYRDGDATTGNYKGYVYMEPPLEPYRRVVPDLDTATVANELVLRHIEGNWYLFCETT